MFPVSLELEYLVPLRVFLVSVPEPEPGPEPELELGPEPELGLEPEPELELELVLEPVLVEQVWSLRVIWDQVGHQNLEGVVVQVDFC